MNKNLIVMMSLLISIPALASKTKEDTQIKSFSYKNVESRIVVFPLKLEIEKCLSEMKEVAATKEPIYNLKKGEVALNRMICKVADIPGVFKENDYVDRNLETPIRVINDSFEGLVRFYGKSHWGQPENGEIFMAFDGSLMFPKNPRNFRAIFKDEVFRDLMSKMPKFGNIVISRKIVDEDQITKKEHYKLIKDLNLDGDMETPGVFTD